MSNPKALEETVEAIDVIYRQHQDAAYQLKVLRAIEQWALDLLPFKTGDKVVLRKSWPLVIVPSSGWYPYREALAPGAIGTATKIWFDAAHKAWVVDLILDYEWVRTSYNDTVYLAGPDSDRRGTFVVGIKHLRKKRKGDTGLVVPSGGNVEEKK